MSKPLARDLVDVSLTTDKPICVIWGSPVGDDPAYKEVLLGSRVPVFRTFANCVRAVRAYFDYHAFRQRYASPFDSVVTRPSPAADIEGVLVSEMVDGGTETVVGVAQDDLFGPTVMLGSGGVLVEVLRDVTFRVPPFGKDDARRMIEELKGYPLLRGARGRPPADLKALVAVIMKAQR